MFFALWRHLDGNTACIFENGAVVEKRGPMSWEKFSIPSRQQQLSQRFQKMPINVFSCQHHKKGQKSAKLWRTCQTTLCHAKTLSKRPNVWILALKCQPGNPGHVFHWMTRLKSQSMTRDSIRVIFAKSQIIWLINPVQYQWWSDSVFCYPILSCFWKKITSTDPNPVLIKIILSVSENYCGIMMHNIHFCVVPVVPHEAK